MSIVQVKELRHVILSALKEKSLHGKTQLSFGELWRACSLAAPSLARPINPELQRERFAELLFENIAFLTTTDMIGVVNIEDDRKIEYIFLTTLGEQYVDGVEFKEALGASSHSSFK